MHHRISRFDKARDKMNKRWEKLQKPYQPKKKTTGKELKEKWMKMSAEMFEAFALRDLMIGDKFIVLSEPGDNQGHGGFKGKYYLFQKLGEEDFGKIHIRCVSSLKDAYIPSNVLVVKVA